MSYLKKHWFDLLIGSVSIGLAIYYLCVSDLTVAAIWLVAACIWLSSSMASDDRERIELLEKKAEKYDALAEEVKALRELQQTYEKLNEQRFKNLEGRNE